MKKIILTENDLHKIISESVKMVVRSINEEGEAAGATNASQSGQFTVPLGVISKGNIYDTATKRSHDFKKGTMTTQNAENEGTDEINKRKK